MTSSTPFRRIAISPIFRQMAFAIVLLALVGSGALAAAQDTTTAEIAFVDPAPQLLAPKSGETFEFDVALKNAGKLQGTPAFKLFGDGCGDVGPATAPPTYEILQPGAVAIQKLRISGAKLPVSCHLELQTQEEKSANRSLKQLKLAQHHVTWFLLYWLWGCLIVSAAAIGLALWLAPPTANNLHLLAPAWDFTKSWTSNLTFAGGIVSGALALSALPELTHHASKAGYATVALLLSFSILVAPLLAALLAPGSITKDTSSEVTVMNGGHVALFYLSCLITLAAGLAQIVVLFFLLHEVFRSGQSSYFCFGAMSCLLGAVMWGYAVRSMVLTIKLERETKTVAADQSGQSPRYWPLL